MYTINLLFSQKGFEINANKDIYISDEDEDRNTMPTTKGGRGRGHRRGRGKTSTKASTISTTHLPAKLGKKMVNCEDFLN